MINTKHNNKIIPLLAFVIYCIGVLTMALHAYKRPHYNWDMLAYMALVVQQSNSDVSTIHQTTYQAAKAHVPSPEYERFFQGDYRKKIAESPETFFKELPFYAVKPLYIKLVSLFHKAGFSLPLSTVLPSIIFYLAIGLLLYHWLLKYINRFGALAFSLLIMYTGPMISLAKLSTPDCLSTFLLLSAFYFIIQKPSIIWTCFFLLLSMFVRLDNIIPCLLIISFLFFTNKWQKKIQLKYYLLLMAVFVGCYFVITAITMKPFGWGTLYYPQFALHLDLSHTANTAFSLKAYLQLVISQLTTALAFHHFVFFLFVALLLFYPRPPFQWKILTWEQAFSLLLLLIISVRFVLFPDLSDRFNMAYYLFFLILLIKKIAIATNRSSLQ